MRTRTIIELGRVRDRLKTSAVTILVLALGSCRSTPTPPQPPIDPAICEADCRAIDQQELGREPDEGGPQEAFLAFVREQPEWAQRQQDLADAAEKAKIVVLPRLRARGQFIEQDTGQWFTVIEATDFMLYDRWMKGLDIEPVLAQREALGFNSVRIFGISKNPWGSYTGDLTPQKYGERYYTELAPFHQALAKHHLYSDWVAFIGPTDSPTPAEQLVHWDRLVNALRPITNVRLSAMNEDNVHPLPTLFKLPRPVGVFSSHGSNGGTPDGLNGANPPEPYWDWTELHTNDTHERQRKVGHNCGELSQTIPCVATENTRANDRLTRTTEAFDSAAGAALLAAGSTFHSLAGRISVLFEGQQLELAKAWIAGAKSVPLGCQAGPYKHRMDLEGPKDLRAYQRGDDPACVVRIRR